MLTETYTKYKTCLSSSAQILSNNFWFSSSSNFFDSSRPLISPWQNIFQFTHRQRSCAQCVLRLLITAYTKSNTTFLLYNVKIEKVQSVLREFLGFMILATIHAQVLKICQGRFFAGIRAMLTSPPLACCVQKG